MAYTRCRTACTLGCSLFLLLVSHAYAKENQVTKGMRFEEALFVVKSSITEATSFRQDKPPTYRGRLRAQDTLEFVGITDEERLNALRRYLVRNTQFGIQSIWGSRGGQVRSYLVPISALSGMKKSTKLEELARALMGEAGLPFMTYKKAAEITAVCRAHAKLEYSQIASGTTIWTDLTPGAQRTTFRQCLLSKDNGIGSVGVVDGEGDYYAYEASYVDLSAVGLATGTYKDVIEAIYRGAAVDFPSTLSSRLTIIGGLFESLGCQEISFHVSTLCLRDNPPTLTTQIFSEITFAEIESLTRATLPSAFPLNLQGFRTAGKAGRQNLADKAGPSVTVDRSKSIGENVKQLENLLEDK